jgi:hypothetical protein
VGNIIIGYPGWSWEGSEQFALRQETCLCGGERTVPRCDLPCMANACELPEPDRLRPQAWENMCVPTCEWACIRHGHLRTWQTTMCDFNPDGSRTNCQITTCDPGVPRPTSGCEN